MNINIITLFVSDGFINMCFMSVHQKQHMIHMNKHINCDDEGAQVSLFR